MMYVLYVLYVLYASYVCVVCVVYICVVSAGLSFIFALFIMAAPTATETTVRYESSQHVKRITHKQSPV
jgi:hypothetical protein